MDRVAPPPGEGVRALGVSLIACFGGVSGVAGLLAVFVGLASAPAGDAMEPASAPGWYSVRQPHPAFSLTIGGLSEPAYAVRHHVPGGGRKDIMTFGGPNAPGAFAAVEVYRPGSELERFADPLQEAAGAAEAFGTILRASAAPAIDSKFGPVGAVDVTVAQTDRQRRCLAFARNFERPRLRISGVYCEPGAQIVNRPVVACALDRLSLMSADGEPAISEFFARAELKRTFCARMPSAASGSGEWIDAKGPPELRGHLAARDE